MIAVRAVDPTMRAEGYATIAATFGAKVAGICRLPPAWMPPSLAISIDLSAAIRAGATSAQLRPDLEAVWPEIETWGRTHVGGAQVLLRSSATTETMLDRGRFLSAPMSAFDLPSFQAVAEKICRHFIALGAAGEMALLLQPMKKPLLEGHVANIKRVSKTRNQWEYEILGNDPNPRVEPWGRFNSPRASPPDDKKSLRPIDNDTDLRGVLRSVGNWLANNISALVSVEWVSDGEATWLVQCDDEGAPPDAINPHELPLPKCCTAEGEAPAPFEKFIVGNPSSVRKLALLNDFSPAGFESTHAIYMAMGDALHQQLADPEARSALAIEIAAFAPERVVIRTDIIEGDPPKNMPRTRGAVDGAGAVAWILEKIGKFEAEGRPARTIAFLMHRFIPARSAAWSFCAPGERFVQVDALWGLPDGIQYYPCDTYEYDLVTDAGDRKSIEFKPYVLWPSLDGPWEKRPVQPQFGRGQCLSQKDLRRIAQHAAAITKSLDRPTQIMWFCDFPQESTYSSPLPWFMEEKPLRPVALAAAPTLPIIPVRTIEQLTALTDAPPSRLLLDPDALTIRENAFLDLVIARAQAGGHSVVLQGSALAHAYYQLTSKGVTVHSLRGPRRQRTLRKREFGKLVRDLVPDVIASRGETASYAPIPLSDRKRLLIAKAMEELWELSEAGEDAENEELADLYEVVAALLDEVGTEWEAIRLEAEKKRQARGGFDQGLVLTETGIPKRDPSSLLIDTPQTRKLMLRPQDALAAATRVDSEKAQATVPFFALLRAEDGAVVRLNFNGRPFDLSLRLEGDRLSCRLEAPAPPDVREELPPREPSEDPQLSLF